MAILRKRKRWNRALHRWSGIILLVPLTVACVTGLILNHTIDLGLSSRFTSSDWIQSRYGMALKGEPEGFGLEGKTYAATWDEKIFFGKKLLDATEPLIGAVPLRDGTAVVTESEVHYFGLDGELIETLDAVALPATPILKAGRSPDLALVLKTESGIFISDANLLGFAQSSLDPSIQWSGPETPSAADRKKWKKAYSGKGVPLDRVILDIHSGRFFGSLGKWIYDITVVGVLILSATGFILFLRTRSRAR